ncbi:hypothetical protein Taro_006949 [Colocasia esculenta]|uniref:Transmembrane protein n=1 Tax=Colocasia esculenta TaxID=4460 RepID=A0A843TTT7_COLES|nr:hypothetical protein [Colocasia esculenta]
MGGGATLGVPGEGSERSGRVRLPCMIRARVAGCSCCCAASVASVVARRVRAVAVRLALDSLVVVFLVWRTLASQSRTQASVGPKISLINKLRCLDAELRSSVEVLPDFFSVGSGGTEVHRLVALCSSGGFPELFVVVLNGALVVLVVVLLGLACIASAVLLAVVFSLVVRIVWIVHSGEGSSQDRPLSLLAEVLPRSALCSFSPELLRVILVVAALSLCRDELSLLPVGLSMLQSACALPVKASCAWSCIWLLHWPACLAVRFQVSSAVLVDFVCPRGSGGLLCSCTRRALADGGLVSVVVLGWLCFVWKCQSHVVVFPLACGRDSCVSPSSALRRFLGVVVLHYGVVLPGCASGLSYKPLFVVFPSGVKEDLVVSRVLFPSGVKEDLVGLDVGLLWKGVLNQDKNPTGWGRRGMLRSFRLAVLGVWLSVAISVVRQALVVTCVQVSPLAFGAVCSVVVPCFGLGLSEVDMLPSTSAVVLLLVWLCVALVSLEADGGVSCLFVWFRWRRSALLTGVSLIAAGNYALYRVLLVTEWVAGRWVTIVRSVGDCNYEDFGWRFLLFRQDLASLGTWGWRSVAFWLPKVKSLGWRSPSLSFFPLPLPPAVLCHPLSPSCVSGKEEGRAWCCGVVDLAWSEEEVAVCREGPSWVRFFVTVTEGDTFVVVSWQRCQEGRPFMRALVGRWPLLRVRACLSLAGLVVCYKPAVRRGFVVLPRLFARCLALEGLSHSEVVSVSWDPHPREPVEGVLRATSVLELEAHVWDAEGFGVLSWHRLDSPLSHCLSLRWFRSHVVVSGARPQLGQPAVLRVLSVSVAALSHPCAGAEAGARLVSRACRLRVPLLATCGGGLVAVVVTTFSSRCFQVFLVTLACMAVLAWLCLAPVGIIGLALGRPVLLVVPTSVFSWFHGHILGCQPRSKVAVLAVRRHSHLVVPWSRQLGARHRGSSLSDGLQRRLWHRVLSVAVRVSVVSSCSLSELRAVFCKSSGSVGGGATLGVPGEGSERSGPSFDSQGVAVDRYWFQNKFSELGTVPVDSVVLSERARLNTTMG